MAGKDRRREPRYTVCRETHFEVALQQRTTSSVLKTTGLLRDLSEGGAKFVVSAPLQVREALAVTFKSEELGIALAISGEVCWTKPEGNDIWTLGCSFAPRLPHEILERFFQGKVVERRAGSRKARRLPIMVRWDYQDPRLPAYLWDISQGGFSMLSTRTAGEHVSIEMQKTRQQLCLEARAQWQATLTSGYMIGCKFAQQNAYDLFERLHPSKPSLTTKIKSLFSRSGATESLAAKEAGSPADN
jgi:PilZ domain-containing protein